MRRILIIFGPLLLLVAVVQVAAQSDIIDVSSAAISCVRSDAIHSAHLYGAGVTQVSLPDLRVGPWATRGQSLPRPRVSSSNLLCVLRC